MHKQKLGKSIVANKSLSINNILPIYQSSVLSEINANIIEQTDNANIIEFSDNVNIIEPTDNANIIEPTDNANIIEFSDNANIIEPSDNANMIEVNNNINIIQMEQAQSFTNINVRSSDPNIQFNTNITPFNIRTTEVLTEYINTTEITSDATLLLSSGYGHTIVASNITYRPILNTSGIINPIDMTMSKIFVCSVNTLLITDNTTDGIEIIIFNRSAVSNIIIRSNLSIICNLCPKTACRLVYIFMENVWIIV